VSAWAFKAYGSASGGSVGSIPTHFRQCFPAMPSRRRPKPFRASKEVKRQARIVVGVPPPVRREESLKQKPPKHRKRDVEYEAGVE